jgi:hypothetical protein
VADAPAEGAGTIDITVTTPGGTSAAVKADRYTYTSAPTVTGISPTAGPLAGANQVTITGTNLGGASAVTFGKSAGTIVSDSATSLVADAPAEGAGTIDITVTTPGGTSAAGNADKYTYTSAPTVTGISPSAGPTGGGTAVTITGANLANATAVKFGPNLASSITLDNASEIIAISPPGLDPPVDVTVTTPGGTSSPSQADEFTYAPAPTVTAVNPSSGPTTGGTTVTIAGTNFANASAVKFGSSAASTFVVDSATEITATSPPGAGTVDVTVTTPGGTSATSGDDEYAYTTAPVVLTGPPVVQGSTAAALSGSVNPDNLPTTASFQYGIDPSERGPGSSTALYDQSTPAQTVGSDNTSHPVSTSLSGLVPHALYHVRLVATNSAGTAVGPDLTFTTPANLPPPPPVLAAKVNVAPVSGKVFIKPPPGKTLAAAGDPAAGAAALSKGQGFLPLTEARQIPTGSEIDALQGSLKLVSATGHLGKTQTATLTGGVFTVTQARTGINKGLDNFSLLDGAFAGDFSYASCTAKGKAGDGHAASLRSAENLLRVRENHRTRTSGRRASATGLGTVWTIADRCDGTSIHDIRDTVLVNDFTRHVTVVLHTGQSYLAKAIARRK